MTKGRTIGLISGKGGVGKTSVCVNLGISLQRMGYETSVIDADFSASNLGVHLGRYDHPVKIQHVLNGQSDPQAALFRHPTGINAVVSSNEIDQVDPQTHRLNSVVDHAAQRSDFVLVDCPPGLDGTVENIMKACDELLIVTMPTQTAGINAAQIVEKAKELQKPILGTVVNMAEEDPEMELIDREVEMMTESHVMTTVPYDQQMKRSLFENQPLVDHQPLSKAALEIRELAASISGEPYERPAFPKIKRGFRKIKQSLS